MHRAGLIGNACCRVIGRRIGQGADDPVARVCVQAENGAKVGLGGLHQPQPVLLGAGSGFLMGENDAFGKIGQADEGDEAFASGRGTVIQLELFSAEVKRGLGIRKQPPVALPLVEDGGRTGVAVRIFIVVLTLDAIVEMDGVQAVFFVVTKLVSTADDVVGRGDYEGKIRCCDRVVA